MMTMTLLTKTARATNQAHLVLQTTMTKMTTKRLPQRLPHPGTLPPMFYRLHPPPKSTPEPAKIPLVAVKAEAAHYTLIGRVCNHTYLPLHEDSQSSQQAGLVRIDVNL